MLNTFNGSKAALTCSKTESLVFACSSLLVSGAFLVSFLAPPLNNFAQRLTKHCPILSPPTMPVPRTRASPSRDGQMSDLKTQASSFARRPRSQWGTTFSRHLREMKSRWSTPLDTCLMKWERCESTSTTRLCRRPFETLAYTSGIRRLGIAKVKMKAKRPKIQAE